MYLLFLRFYGVEYNIFSLFRHVGFVLESRIFTHFSDCTDKILVYFGFLITVYLINIYLFEIISQ